MSYLSLIHIYGVNPFVDVCKKEKKGLFILVKTSNPSSGEFQDRLIEGRPLYELVGEKVAEWGEAVSYTHLGNVCIWENISSLISFKIPCDITAIVRL